MYNAMIVDDEPIIREYMKINIPLINKLWQITAEAMDGCEALSHIEKQNFDLIITDIKMPVMDGLELCKNISEKYTQQKILILSGHDEFSFAKESMKYNVYDYLLKPVVREELMAILEKITHQIEKEENERTAYSAMIKLSEDSKKQIVKNFLKAVILNSGIEIKTLYPLIFRMKLSLIESEGIVMILDLDEDVILEKSIPINDIPVLKFILNQITNDIVDGINKNSNLIYGRVFLDSSENTNILVTGEDKASVKRKCKEIFTKVSSSMNRSTAITITGGAGIPVNDVLQLNDSYEKALIMLTNRLYSGGNSLYMFQDDNSTNTEYIQSLEKAISGIKSGILDERESTYIISITNYVNLMHCYTDSSILNHGIYLIKSISKLKPEYTEELINKSLKVLRGFMVDKSDIPLKDKAINTFKNIASVYVNRFSKDLGNIDENDIVVKAKDYIYSHYAEPISLTQIAEIIGISSSYLSNVFHKNVGESYIKFLTRIRMEQAARLLRARPKHKILTVSEKVGYISVKHFSYIFKQHYNMTPGEYQQK